MPPSKKPFPFVLAAAAAAALPSAAHALALVDVENLDSYAAIATLTVTKASPGKPGGEQVTSYSMAWNGVNRLDAYAVSDDPGVPRFVVDFTSLITTDAPASFGPKAFLLDFVQAAQQEKMSDLDTGAMTSGPLDIVLPLAQSATDIAVWEETARKGVHTATYRLFLFDTRSVPAPVAAVSPAAVPEPGLLALLGIGLGGLAVTRRRKAV